MSSCERKFLPVTGYVLLWQEILSVTENFVQWKERSSFNRKLLPVPESLFLQQEISSCNRKFLPETENFFLWHKVSNKKFLFGKRVFLEYFILLKKNHDISAWFLVICQNCYKSAWSFFITSPEGSRLPAKILGSLAAKISSCL